MSNIPRILKHSLGWFYFALEYGRIRKKRKRFRYREARNLESLFEEYYSKTLHDKVRFEYVWNRIAQILKLDPKRLRPQDRFSCELAPVSGAEIDDELDELEEFILEEIGQIGIDADIQKIKTLNDLVMNICR
jgi:hypothetical protein